MLNSKGSFSPVSSKNIKSKQKKSPNSKKFTMEDNKQYGNSEINTETIPLKVSNKAILKSKNLSNIDY